MTVLDNLMLARHQYLKYSVLHAVVFFGRASRQEAENRNYVEEVIDFMELEPYRKRTVGSLAYGIQKRVEMARALTLGPKLLLLDEPMAGMNVEEKEDMVRFILDIQKERGITRRAGRARPGGGDGHLRPGLRPGLRPTDRGRQPRRGRQRTGRSSRPTSGKSDAPWTTVIDLRDITIPQLLRWRVQHSPEGVALREKEFGCWNNNTWAHYYEQVRKTRPSAWSRSGFEPGDTFAVISDNIPEMLVMAVGAQAAGGMSAGHLPVEPPGRDRRHPRLHGRALSSSATTRSRWTS